MFEELVLSPEFREKHKLPDKKVPAANIATAAPEWKDALRQDKWWEAERLEGGLCPDSMDAAVFLDFQKLHTILLSIGGSETCFPIVEEDMGPILERGIFRPGRSKLRLMSANQCHSNVAYLWKQLRETVDATICTGYALSEDGMWRQHTWLVYSQKTGGRVIETTAKRVAYYGVELTEEEAQVFFDNVTAY